MRRRSVQRSLSDDGEIITGSGGEISKGVESAKLGVKLGYISKSR